MTWPTHRPNREAHAVSDYWDKLVRQQPALPVPPPDLPASEGAMLRQLHAEEELASTPAYQGELLHRLLATYGETAPMPTTIANSQPFSPSSFRRQAPAPPIPDSSASTGQAVSFTRWGDHATRGRFDRIATGVLAVVLVIAIGGGAWLAADRPLTGDHNEPPVTSRFGGYIPVVTVEPDTSMSVFPGPDAKCDADRPSRSWVVDHLIEGRGGYTVAYERYELPIRPTADQRDAIVAVFGSWMSCRWSDVPFAYSFVYETPRYTFRDGFGDAFIEGRPDPDEIQGLASIALGPNPWRDQETIPNEVLATPIGSRDNDLLPLPPGATPAIGPFVDDDPGFWPVIFGDEIQVVSPTRAVAVIYLVNPRTMEIQIGGYQDQQVEFQLVDGVWLIDYFGATGMG